MPGVGKIALSAMIPILSAKGIDVASLPTALVSNTLDFGKFDILDTTDYMEKTVDIWHELGFHFDCISTGFMVNPRQIDIVEKLINNQAKENLLVVVDPIMGDEGKLYNGMTENNVAIMRKLSSYADILIPNFTEACFLTNHFYEEETLSKEQAADLLTRVRKLGARSVVITSASVEGNAIWSERKHKISTLPGGKEKYALHLEVPMLSPHHIESHCCPKCKKIIIDASDYENNLD